MNRVFIQAHARYPHGGALANYIQNLAEAIVCAGYEVILVSAINGDYDMEFVISSSKPIVVIPIVPSQDELIRQEQRRTGYYVERFGVLEKYNADNGDCVIVLDIWNEYFLRRLFEFGKKAGFKTICGAFELYGAEDYETKEEYENFRHVYEEIYLNADAILSVSEYIDKFYIDKGMRVYRLPPLVACGKFEPVLRSMDKWRFIIPSQKDSLQSMLKAFAGLKNQELEKIELHLCGCRKEKLYGLMEESEWERVRPCTVVHDWLKYEELTVLCQQMHFLLIARNVSRRTLANFPSKVPECMELGVVPVVSDVGDYTKYYLKDGVDSIFIQGDTVEEITKSIRKAMSLSVKHFEEYSQNAMLCAKTKFDYHNWIDEIQEMVQGK